MKVKKKKNILIINKDERSSRFVVDLAKQEEKQEKKEEFNFSEALDKIAEIDTHKIFAPVKEKINLNKNLETPKFDFKSTASAMLKRLEPLAFFFVIKLVVLLIAAIGNFIYKLCFWSGWLLVFFTRFIALICLNFGKSTVSIFRNFFRVLKEGMGFLTGIFSNMFTFRTLTNVQEKIQEVPLEDINFEPKRISIKSIGFFILFCFIIILPFKALSFYKDMDFESIKGKVLGASEKAINSLMSASESAQNMNFAEAQENFSKAGEGFLQAEEQLGEINNIFFNILSLAPNEKIKLAGESKKILQAGEISSKLGENLSLAMDSLFKNPVQPLMEKLDNLSKFGGEAARQTADLKRILSEINPDALPKEYRNQFSDINNKVAALDKGFESFSGGLDHLKSFLGKTENKRYLFVFQNNAEIRATGGFIGSYALIDFSNGKIINIETPTGGSYDTEGGLKELVTAPEPLWLVNPLWHFWDANWWPDWPTSAEKLMWFYEKSDGPTVDGVVSLTPSVMEKLLEVIGPVDMTAEYGVIIDSDNFWSVTQGIAEKKLTPEEEKAGIKHESKKIIGDLLNKIIAELPNKLNKENLAKLLKITDESLNEKQVLFYFKDKELENEISNRGWGGEIADTSKDYLMVVNTNIAGGKSDRKIFENINIKSEFQNDGSIINEVTIERTHEGVKNEPFTGVRNVDWMRIYVPQGSELISSEGWNRPDDIYFTQPEETWEKDPKVLEEEALAQEGDNGVKIYNENSKTVFANWSMVDPGETAIIKLKYKLPFALKKDENKNIFDTIRNKLGLASKELYPYSLLVQKQSGSKNDEVNVNWGLPADLKPVWKYPDNLTFTTQGAEMQTNLQEDKYWGAVLEKIN